MKKLERKLRSFGQDPPGQATREIAILAAVILLTVTIGLLFSL